MRPVKTVLVTFVLIAAMTALWDWLLQLSEFGGAANVQTIGGEYTGFNIDGSWVGQPSIPGEN